LDSCCLVAVYAAMSSWMRHSICGLGPHLRPQKEGWALRQLSTNGFLRLSPHTFRPAEQSGSNVQAHLPTHIITFEPSPHLTVYLFRNSTTSSSSSSSYSDSDIYHCPLFQLLLSLRSNSFLSLRRLLSTHDCHSVFSSSASEAVLPI